MVVKRIAVIAASLMLVLSMSATVFASQDASTPTIATSGSIVIEKNLKVKNPTLTSVDGPGATFNYAIAPVAPVAGNGGTTITDAQNHTATVHQGPANGVALSAASITYPIGTAVDASDAGADNIKNITATADVSKFSAPGIYRYEVSETFLSEHCEVVNNGNGTRYIDVYVENGESGLTIAGMVMHEGSIDSAHKKTFDNAEFETVNIEVKKQVTGNMADKNHEFPFAMTVSDSDRYYYDGEGATAAAATNKNTTAASSGTLKDGESFWLCGISKSGTVTATETNNTADTYKTAVSGLATVAQSDVAPNGTKPSGDVATSAGGQILFTNTLDSVSPTGVIMRFGPYVGMVLAAMAFAFIFRRTRKSNNA